MSINPNPPAGLVWLKERGAPYRADWEFKQITVDNRASEEIFQKRIVQLGKKNERISLLYHFFFFSFFLVNLQMYPSILSPPPIQLNRVQKE